MFLIVVINQFYDACDNDTNVLLKLKKDCSNKWGRSNHFRGEETLRKAKVKIRISPSKGADFFL